jgi:hypothetical protein
MPGQLGLHGQWRAAAKRPERFVVVVQDDDTFHLPKRSYVIRIDHSLSRLGHKELAPSARSDRILYHLA